MEVGTTFHFVTDGIQTALRLLSGGHHAMSSTW